MFVPNQKSEWGSCDSIMLKTPSSPESLNDRLAPKLHDACSCRCQVCIQSGVLGRVYIYLRVAFNLPQMERWWGKASHKQKFAGSSVELLVRAMLQVASC